MAPSKRLAAFNVVLAFALAGTAASQQAGPRPFWPEIQAFMGRGPVTRCCRLPHAVCRLVQHTPLARSRRRYATQKDRTAWLRRRSYRARAPLLRCANPPSPPTGNRALCGRERYLRLAPRRPQVVADLGSLIEIKRRTLGATPVYYIAIKPSIRRWHEFPRQAQANAMIKTLAESNRDLIFIDVVRLMLQGGRPRNIFKADGLHMNRSGYSLWARAINAALDKTDGSALSPCQKKPN